MRFYRNRLPNQDQEQRFRSDLVSQLLAAESTRRFTWWYYGKIQCIALLKRGNGRVYFM
jgi:hypothetical protein